MKISLVIPSYNEEERLGKLLKGVKKTKLYSVVVDDGSKDKTFLIARKYASLALKHRINLGKGAAMKTGAQAAFKNGADAVIFMDSDGQHDLEDLPKFIEALEAGNDVVFGSRNLNFQVPLVRFLGNKFGSVLINIFFGIYVSDLLCGYRGITKKAFKKMEWQSSGYGVETEMVILAAKERVSYCEVEVKTLYFDKFKGVTILDALGIFGNVVKWRLIK